MINYEISMCVGYAAEIRRGHLIECKQDGYPAVYLVLHKASGGWKVDHFKTGCAVGIMDRCALCGRIDLKTAIASVKSQFTKYGYGEKFSKAPKYREINTLTAHKDVAR